MHPGSSWYSELYSYLVHLCILNFVPTSFINRSICARISIGRLVLLISYLGRLQCSGNFSIIFQLFWRLQICNVVETYVFVFSYFGVKLLHLECELLLSLLCECELLLLSPIYTSSINPSRQHLFPHVLVSSRQGVVSSVKVLQRLVLLDVK